MSRIERTASILAIVGFTATFLYTMLENRALKNELTDAQLDAHTRYALLEYSVHDEIGHLRTDIEAEQRGQAQPAASHQGEEGGRAEAPPSRPISNSSPISSQSNLRDSTAPNVKPEMRLPDDIQTIWVILQTKGPIEQAKCRMYAVVSPEQFQDRIEEFRNEAVNNNEKLIVTALSRKGQWINQITYGSMQLSPTAPYTCNGKIDYGFEIPLDR